VDVLDHPPKKRLTAARLPVSTSHAPAGGLCHLRLRSHAVRPSWLPEDRSIVRRDKGVSRCRQPKRLTRRVESHSRPTAGEVGWWAVSVGDRLVDIDGDAVATGKLGVRARENRQRRGDTQQPRPQRSFRYTRLVVVAVTSPRRLPL